MVERSNIGGESVMRIHAVSKRLKNASGHGDLKPR